MDKEQELKLQYEVFEHGNAAFKFGMFQAGYKPKSKKLMFAWALSTGYEKWLETGQGTAEELPGSLVLALMQGYEHVHSRIVEKVVSGDLSPVWDVLKGHVEKYPGDFLAGLGEANAHKEVGGALSDVSSWLGYGGVKKGLTSYSIGLETAPGAAYEEFHSDISLAKFKEMYECEPVPVQPPGELVPEQIPMKLKHVDTDGALAPGKDMTFAEFLKYGWAPGLGSKDYPDQALYEKALEAYGIPGGSLGQSGQALSKLKADAAAKLSHAKAKSVAYMEAYGGPDGVPYAENHDGAGIGDASEQMVWLPFPNGGGGWVQASKKNAIEKYVEQHLMGKPVGWPGGQCSVDGCSDSSPHGHVAEPLTGQKLDEAIDMAKNFEAVPGIKGFSPSFMIHDDIVFQTAPAEPDLLPAIKTHTHLMGGLRTRCADPGCPVGS